METIDILQPRYTECSYFEVDVNAAGGSVPVTLFASAILGIWGTEGFQYTFQERDNIRILTAGFYIPEAFTMANTVKTDTTTVSNSLQILVYDNTGIPWDINPYMPGLSTNGQIAQPFYNYEMALDIFCDMANYHKGGLPENEFSLRARQYCNDISMVGVPAGLDGKTIKVVPFLKILHTKPIL